MLFSTKPVPIAGLYLMLSNVILAGSNPSCRLNRLPRPKRWISAQPAGYHGIMRLEMEAIARPFI